MASISLVLLLLAVQPGQARVTGVVRSAATGAPLGDAAVALPDLARAAVTGGAGEYTLAAIPPGPHHLTVRRLGYAPRTLHVLVPRTGPVEVHVALTPVAASLPTVHVRRRAAIPVRGVDASDRTPHPDRGLTRAALAAHPLLAEPDALQALVGGSVAARAESPEGLHVRGAPSDQTAYLLDEFPVLGPYHAAGTFAAWNPDAVAHVALAGAAPPPWLPGALGGVVTATTRAPGARLGVQGAFGTTQARVTLDGPLGGPLAGAGFLLAIRSGFPGPTLRRAEPSYLTGETGDWLAKVEAPAFGGRLRVLAYESANELSAAAAVEPGGPGPRAAPRDARNGFEWRARSAGVSWEGVRGRASARLVGWHALGEAEARWDGDGGRPRVTLAAGRRDLGALASIAWRSGAGATTTAGVKAERSATTYEAAGDDADGDERAPWTLTGRTPSAVAFARHERAVGRTLAADVGASLVAVRAGARLAPRAQLRWSPARSVTVSGSAARSYQLAQSLRNAESVVGNVFPADLFVGAGVPGVPVARADQAVLAADWRPSAWLRLAAEAYARRSTGLLLVAAADGDGGPFAVGGAAPAFRVGAGTARGVALDAAAAGARYGAQASYAVELMRLRTAGTAYVPAHAAAHRLDAGVVAFPTATLSVRLGASATAGRRTTAVADGMEWEACNLLDGGCEFAGSPSHRGQPPGGAALPPYARVDLGARKHWHVGRGERVTEVAVFGTLTNVLGRRNVLTWLVDGGASSPVEMRPRAPLVVGIDWRR